MAAKKPGRKKRRTYSAEFKAEAVARVRQGDSPAEVARDLGCHRNQLYKWMTQIPAVRQPAHPAHLADNPDPAHLPEGFGRISDLLNQRDEALRGNEDFQRVTVRLKRENHLLRSLVQLFLENE